ncbi:hypothetical protein DNTS_025708 [Danionella cerebrum]|uniref:Uncharacterized protein n=1 Tax=Danionella cerebrum TaxID=2873325 RepID=A0A553MTD4_9TELE|nr:hypothetical protein DNTS_025708 [Danionella translucida]
MSWEDGAACQLRKILKEQRTVIFDMHHGNRPQVAGVFEAVEFVSCAPALASHSRFPLADCQSKAVPVTAHRTSAQLDPSADSPVTHGGDRSEHTGDFSTNILSLARRKANHTMSSSSWTQTPLKNWFVLNTCWCRGINSPVLLAEKLVAQAQSDASQETNEKEIDDEERASPRKRRFKAVQLTNSALWNYLRHILLDSEASEEHLLESRDLKLTVNADRNVKAFKRGSAKQPLAPQQPEERDSSSEQL